VTAAQASDRGRAARLQRRLLTESDYHQARILLLLAGFTDGEEPFIGLTRLVKLDFLLRYPAMATRLFPVDAGWTEGAEPARDELLAVESRMIRYRYGPWDDRYYPMLGALVGRGMLVFTGGRSFAVRVTELGRRVASQIAELPEWQRTAARIPVLREHLNLSGEQLKNMIYEHLDEVAALPHGAEI
jgi:hypothetical protein